MRRISPVLVVLLAAGCANAGITDWLNPFGMFGGRKHPAGPAAAPVSSAPQHSPRSSGHRGTRQSHNHHHPTGPHGGQGPVPQPPIGSPPGALDDGFRPSFPPGFANPPNHSPNLNPFASVIGEGSESNAKGPFLPSQLTQYHVPANNPHTPLVAPGPNPTLPPHKSGFRSRFPFGGGRGPRSRGHKGSVPPHAAVAEGSSHSGDFGPAGSDPGNPVPLTEFPGLTAPIKPPAEIEASPAEYEETPTTPPESAPQQRRPQGFLARLRGIRNHPRGPRPGSNYNAEHGKQSEGPRGNYGNFDEHDFGHGGPPAGPPNGASFHDNNGPDPFLNEGHSGGSSPININGLGGLGGLGGGRPGVDAFYAGSPGSNSPFAPVIPDQGPQGPSPFSNPQGSGGFGSGRHEHQSPFGSVQSFGGQPEGIFGGGESGPGPRGPPQRRPQRRPHHGRPPPSGGPQSFFGNNGNDYPEQFEGGDRGARQPTPLSPNDYRPQPNGPPDASQHEDQSPGFFGAIHNSESNPQLPNFFNDQSGGGPSGPPAHDNGPGHNLFGAPSGPGNSGIFGAAPGGDPGHNFGQHQLHHHQNHHHQQQHQQQQSQRPNRPLRFGGIRNPFAAFHQGSSSTMPAYGTTPLLMSASGNKPVASLPVPKGSRLLRPYVKRPGIVALSSPKDPNYRPMRLGASSLRPISAPYEPETAASGGFHGGYGDVGLTHNGDRILYHVAGHKGPYSYQFGYDTGKGRNRLFRFEEKDGKGFVKGKYGFYDKHGKLNIINYMAHPKHGYHAERGHTHGHY